MDDTVTISRAEYERLVEAAEELADIAALNRAKARLEAGEDELVPAAFANRIIDGESPVRVYRELRGLSVSALARQSGVNRVQIMEIESGRKTRSVATVVKLARALGVDVDDLIELGRADMRQRSP